MSGPKAKRYDTIVMFAKPDGKGSIVCEAGSPDADEDSESACTLDRMGALPCVAYQTCSLPPWANFKAPFFNRFGH